MLSLLKREKRLFEICSVWKQRYTFAAKPFRFFVYGKLKITSQGKSGFDLPRSKYASP